MRRRRGYGPRPPTFATIVEQASFLAAGLFLWLTCARATRGTPARDAAGAFALLLTSVHMTLLGALLSLAPRPLYGLGDVTCFGLVLGAGEDQALGGVIMLMIGAAVYLAGGVFLLGAASGRPAPGGLRADARQLEAPRDRPGDPAGGGAASPPGSASSMSAPRPGHWKITEWFLHFAMRSAVRTYALAVEVPDELPRHAIQPAAGHFARGCAICHGAPGEPRSPAVHLMLPQPPDLAGKVGEWTDAELFRIVKHGVRFTGMPAWPTQQRDDEVWAMVAFLRELPDDGRSRRWRDLAYGGGERRSANAPISTRRSPNARAATARTGSAAAQRRLFLPDRARPIFSRASTPMPTAGAASGVMAIPVNAVDPRLFADLARHFSALPAPAARRAAGCRSCRARRGDRAARAFRQHDVPACLGCHGRPDRNPVYPELVRPARRIYRNAS